MCMACSAPLDTTKRDAFADQLLGMLNGGMTGLLISVGHRSGLFDVMSDGEARTSHELAEAGGANERYVREWLGGMVAARIVERDPETGTHVLPPEHAHWLSRKNPTGNMAVFAQYLSVLGSVEDRILACFREGGGVPYSAYTRFHEVMAEDSGQSIVPIVVSDVVPLIPGLEARLRAGIDVLDIGCGKGRALIELAKSFPNSRFTGYDLSPEALAEARAQAHEARLTNIRFEERDLTVWSEPGSFDWITAFDAIHDQARPDLVLAAIRAALRPGGVFFMQDIDASSEPVDNIEHPLGALLYAVSCMHCMTVSLAQGGEGLGAMWGEAKTRDYLARAGFGSVVTHRLAHDIQNNWYVVEK